MKDKITKLFLSDEGKDIYRDVFRAIDDYGMSERMQKGVLVCFSGGPDSVMLLSFLAYFSGFGEKLPVVAVHINHGIRGGEADRDESFARSFCEALGIECICRRVDVPTLAAESKKGLEECARDCRYSEFADIICSRNDVSTICVAHNADDNLETILLNLLRGSGTRGVSGIPPVRENIIRPLIYLSKKRIVEALSASDIEYVLDSTNSCNEYKRNFIRNEILPKLREISDFPEEMASRVSRNLRCDDEYISRVAKDFVSSSEKITNRDLLSLDEAVYVRVVSLMTGSSLSSKNLIDLRRLLEEDNFTYYLPGDKVFVCERCGCRVECKSCLGDFDFIRKLSYGKNCFDEYDADIIISDTKINDSVTNVYKFSIQADISSAIIKGDLFVRSKTDGDTVRYGGMTRKLKKLFNDRKIPKHVRSLIPVICDDDGVVWLPGFGVRDDGAASQEGNGKNITLCIGKGETLKSIRFYSGNETYK